MVVESWNQGDFKMPRIIRRQTSDAITRKKNLEYQVPNCKHRKVATLVSNPLESKNARSTLKLRATILKSLKYMASLR